MSTLSVRLPNSLHRRAKALADAGNWAAGCDYIVTYNKRDFPEVETLFGIKVVNALEFLKIIDAL